MCGGLHGAFTEGAAQQSAQVSEHRLAEDDEDPRVNYGVEGVEAEGRQVRRVAGKWVNGVDEAGDLWTEKVEVGRYYLVTNKTMENNRSQ